MTPLYKKISIAVTVLFIISISGNIYMGNEIRILTQDPVQVNAKEISDISAKLARLMVLPTDETPTLATVSDPEKLKNQAFFANAKAGFKVLVYAKAQKAILFDPYTNKIVEVAPINSNTPATTTTLIK